MIGGENMMGDLLESKVRIKQEKDLGLLIYNNIEYRRYKEIKTR